MEDLYLRALERLRAPSDVNNPNRREIAPMNPPRERRSLRIGRHLVAFWERLVVACAQVVRYGGAQTVRPRRIPARRA